MKIISDSVVCQGIPSEIRSSSSAPGLQWYIKSNLAGTDTVIHWKFNDPDTEQVKLTYKCGPFELADSINIRVSKVPESDLPKQLILCENESKTICVTFNSTAINYTWSNGSKDSCLEIHRPGSYILRLKNQYCTSSDTLKVTTKMTPHFTIWQMDTVCLDGTNAIRLSILTDTFPKISWMPDQQSLPQLTIKTSEPRVIRVTGTNNCVEEQVYQPVNNCRMLVYIPNGFSPNDDGINDDFMIRGVYIEHIQMSIYNLWGEELFNTNSMTQGWDGTYQNHMCPQGTYMYVIKVQSQGMVNNYKEIQIFSGTLELIY